MSADLKIVLAQINVTVGDIAGNVRRVVETTRRAQAEFAPDLVVFPELTLTGYPPEDLLFREDFIDAAERAVAEVGEALRDVPVLVGHPERADGALYNAASLLDRGRVAARYRKRLLPNYAVFDEKRWFQPGTEACIVRIKGVPLGLTICEDVWNDGPVEDAVARGASAILNLNASPFHLDKGLLREQVVGGRAARLNVPILYVNLVGGQDELVFDGDSFVVDAKGAVTHRAPAFEEALLPVRLHAAGSVAATLDVRAGSQATPLTVEESAFGALVLGVRDYLGKNGFPGVVIGLSGGVDSALTLCIAVDALGAERVLAVAMPSRYTASMSIDDARAQAEAMGVEFRVIPIEPMFESFLDGLRGSFAGLGPDTAEENIQARVRGTLLMALSNKTGRMVLTTGNKSEMAVGYCTLYGDMAGGFAVIKDVPKTLVYRLAQYRNRIHPVIPRRVIERAPSAELRPDQKDTDSLPPYDVLDPILERYVERDESLDRIVAAGFDEALVRRVIRMVDANEYKRRQAPPGVRITPRAFGRDRRYPVTSGFRR